MSIQVGDLARQQFADVEALVDTGATYNLLPKEVLDRLGFGQEGTTPLLGATTLGHLSLAVDSIHQRLMPVTALLKRGQGSFTKAPLPTG